jgi:hypothetical protein
MAQLRAVDERRHPQFVTVVPVSDSGAPRLVLMGRSARFGRLLYGIALLSAMFAFDNARSAAGSAPASAGPAREQVSFVASLTLPAGFSDAVDAATAQRFQHVATFDVDNDGDLDIAANVGTLELLVWENQGGGHFSLISPRRGAVFQAEPPGPALGDGADSTQWLKHDNRPWSPIERLDPGVDERVDRVLFTRARSLTERLGLSVQTPRAPPPARSL